MTTDKLTPTHPLAHLLAHLPSPIVSKVRIQPPHPLPTTNFSVCDLEHPHWSTLLERLSPFLLPSLRRQAQLETTPWGDFRTGKHHGGFSTGVLSISDVTLVLWIKYGPGYHLELFPLGFPCSPPSITVSFNKCIFALLTHSFSELYNHFVNYSIFLDEILIKVNSVQFIYI